jgi:pectin methylesterase-like acyl-CoA thioesterase
MTARKHRSSEKEKALAAKLYAGRNEASDWDETSIEAQVQPHRAVVTSLRLPVDEFTAVQKAAKASGQTVSEFIRAAIGIRLRGGVRLNALQIATGAPEGQSQATVLTPILESGQTRNPDPEMIAVPMYANMTR